MPRRMARPHFMRRSTRVKVPKPLKTKAVKLETGSLEECYQWLNFDRVMGFNLVLDWYATNTPKLLYGAPLQPEQMSTFNKAEKAYRLGCSTDQIGEREQAFRTAIRCYERVFIERHKLPALKEEEPPAASRRTAAMAATLKTLNSAFGGIGMSFVPTPKPEREFINGIVQVPMEQLSSMAESGLMAAAFSEFVSAVKCASLVPDPDNNGSMRLDGNRLFNESIPRALEGLLQWSASIPPKELFRKHTLKPIARTTTTPTDRPRAPRSTGAKLDKDGIALSLMQRPGGATAEEITSATGWTGLWFGKLKARGVVITSTKSTQGTGRVYSVAQ